jgi:phosphocarrier protein
LKRIEVKIANRLGLHARAAAKFVQLANRFRSRITVTKDASRVDGKSILGLLTLAASEGTVLGLEADGEDSETALGELQSLVSARFGEEA